MTHTKSKFLSMTFFTSLFMMLLLSNSVFANTTEVNNAEQRVLQVTARLLDLLEKNKVQYSTDENALNTMVNREILPFVDVNGMSRLILGKHWKTATPAQRTRFTNSFTGMLIRNYGRTMVSYSGSSIRAGNSTPRKKPGYVLVRTLVTTKSSSSIPANYSLRKIGNEWKAYNFEIAGVDLVTNFRTNFTREVSANGLDALITRIESTGK